MVQCFLVPTILLRMAGTHALLLDEAIHWRHLRYQNTKLFFLAFLRQGHGFPSCQVVCDLYSPYFWWFHMEQIWNKFRELSLRNIRCRCGGSKTSTRTIDPRAPFRFVFREFLLIECNHDHISIRKDLTWKFQIQCQNLKRTTQILPNLMLSSVEHV